MHSDVPGIHRHPDSRKAAGCLCAGAGNGIDLTRQLKRRSPLSRVLILSGYPGERMIAAAFDAGVVGYFLRQCDASDLPQAVRMVASGMRYLSEPINGNVLDGCPSDGAKDPYETLTARQKEVLQLAAAGLSNGSIADRLFISLRTVEHHRETSFRKLGIRSQTELVRFAHWRGVQTIDGL